MHVKISLTEGTPYVTCSANFFLSIDDGFCERFITPSGARPYIYQPSTCLFYSPVPIFLSSQTSVEPLRNHWSLLTKGGVRENKRYGQVVQ